MKSDYVKGQNRHKASALHLWQIVYITQLPIYIYTILKHVYHIYTLQDYDDTNLKLMIFKTHPVGS